MTSADQQEGWLERLERMIDDYRADQHRQLLQQLTKCRRLADADRLRVADEQRRRAN